MADCAHLPRGMQMEMTPNHVVLTIRMTTAAHGLALKDALDVAIIPILKLMDAEREEWPAMPDEAI